jgi:hypothetical protein
MFASTFNGKELVKQSQAGQVLPAEGATTRFFMQNMA